MGTSPTPGIGPNSVLQTLAAIEALEGAESAETIRRRADLPDEEWTSLVPEAFFVRLLAALHDELGEARAERILAESGERTAAYVASHRIPAAVRALFRVLPSRLALPLLLKAFAKHAWTFAGAGEMAIEGGYPGAITLRRAPTCRDGHGHARGAYYRAAFEGLLRLADPRVRVRETHCEATGADRCRFTIAIDQG